MRQTLIQGEYLNICLCSWQVIRTNLRNMYKIYVGTNYCLVVRYLSNNNAIIFSVLGLLNFVNIGNSTFCTITL